MDTGSTSTSYDGSRDRCPLLERQPCRIALIENSRRRSNTQCKRTRGLMKKAMELAVPTGSKVSIVVVTPGNVRHEFVSSNQGDRDWIAPSSCGRENSREIPSWHHRTRLMGVPGGWKITTAHWPMALAARKSYSNQVERPIVDKQACSCRQRSPALSPGGHSRHKAILTLVVASQREQAPQVGKSGEESVLFSYNKHSYGATFQHCWNDLHKEESPTFT